MYAINISSRSMRQRFHGCEPDYIRDVCKGACCRSSTSPTGVRIGLLPAEEEVQRSRGLTVLNGRLEPLSGERRCPHQTEANLCGLHFTPDKPFGCIASPFILTSRDTLIVRNRYRLLRCYRDGDLPAYRAFRSSLDLLFGESEAGRIVDALERGSDDLWALMPDASYAALRHLQARPPSPVQSLGL